MHRLSSSPLSSHRRWRFSAEDKKERERKTVKDTELKKESTGGPAKDLAGSIERKKTESGKAAPALQYDQFRLGVEMQVATKRREQIDDLKKIIELNGGHDEGDARAALPPGRALLGRVEVLLLRGQPQRRRLINAMNAGTRRRRRRPRRRRKSCSRKSKEYGKLAIEQYTEIVQKYKDFERTDEVLYFLGQNLMEHGRRPKSARRVQAADREVPEVQVPARRVPGVRRVLLQQLEGQARHAREGARVLQEGRRVPREPGLRLRALQAGLVLLQPGRLPEGDGHVQGGRPLRRASPARAPSEKDGGKSGKSSAGEGSAQRLRARLRPRDGTPRTREPTSASSPRSPTTASR